MPENYFDPEKGVKGEDFRKDFDAMSTERAAEAVRRNSLPKTVEEFKYELPKDFKPPEGLSFELKPDDPLVAQYRTLALEAGLDQEKFSKGLGLIAAVRLGEQVSLKKAYDGEVAKLGAAGPARVDAVTDWLKAVGGADAAPLINVLRMAPVASTVIALETMIKKVTAQGGGNYSASRREGVEAQRISDEAYKKLSYTEQKEYAEQFQQPAAQNGAGR